MRGLPLARHVPGEREGGGVVEQGVGLDVRGVAGVDGGDELDGQQRVEFQRPERLPGVDLLGLQPQHGGEDLHESGQQIGRRGGERGGRERPAVIDHV